jgi:hypothetical protein
VFARTKGISVIPHRTPAVPDRVGG